MMRRLKSLFVVMSVFLLSISFFQAEVDAKPRKGKASVSKSRKGSRGSGQRHKRTNYTIRSGDTLGAVAEEHGVKLKDLLRWNKLKPNSTLRVGQKIKIYTSSKSSGKRKGTGRVKRKVTHIVRKGNTTGGIAEKYGVTLKQLKKWNSRIRKRPNSLKIGQKITIWIKSSATSSSSIGHAARGHLVNGEVLPKSKGYFIRTRSRVYGTNHTITNLIEVTNKVVSRFPRAPKLVIGDISFKKGGKMRPHKSHQSGRDVDAGYYPKGNKQLANFVKMRKGNFDLAKNWFIVKTLIDSGQVEYIFIDRSLQRLLYKHARSKGISEKYLNAHLQYPRGKGASGAEVRHVKGHTNHMHIRFKCPKGDSDCR